MNDKNSIWFYFVLVLYVAGCTLAPAVVKKGDAIAVWDLENLNPTEFAGTDIGEILSVKVIETFKESANYTVVERERLLLVLEELNLGTTDLISESTRLKIGRIAGARLMVFGTYMIINDTVRLDLRIVEVETGIILKATSKTAPGADLTGWLKIVQEATRELL